MLHTVVAIETALLSTVGSVGSTVDLPNSMPTVKPTLV